MNPTVEEMRDELIRNNHRCFTSKFKAMSAEEIKAEYKDLMDLIEEDAYDIDDWAWRRENHTTNNI